MEIKTAASTGLAQAGVMCFLSSTNLDSALAFYSDKLELPLSCQDDYALEYQLSNSKLRITYVNKLNPAAHTILGWVVNDIEDEVSSLQQRGIEFIFYDGMPQDELGICTFPGNSRVAWFHDPDLNVLSITQAG